MVPLDSPRTASRPAGYLDARLRRGKLVQHLRLWVPVLFLVAVTAILEHWHVFQPFDDIALSIAIGSGNAGNATDGLTAGADAPGVVVVFIGERMFEAEFGRQLPVNADMLARVISAVAAHRPERIAIDIDLAKPAADARRPVYDAVVAALKCGIDVVGIPYRRHTPAGRIERNSELRDLCKRTRPFALEQACPAGSPPVLVSAAGGNSTDPPRSCRGRFYLASPRLTTIGEARSVVDLPDLKGQPFPAPLGAAAALLGKKELADDYCELVRGLGEGDNGRILHGIDDDPEAKAGKKFINYLFEPQAPIRIVELNSLAMLESLPPSMLAKSTVLLGVRSFGGLDEFVTPLGRKAGVEVHAHVANSIERGIEPDLRGAALFDLAAGLLFSYVAVFGHAQLQRLHHVAPNIAGALHLALLPSLLLLFVAGTLASMPTLLGRGLWLNPLAVFLGLTAHAYYEAVSPGKNEAHPRLHSRLRARQRARLRARQPSHLRGHPAKGSPPSNVLARFLTRLLARYFDPAVGILLRLVIWLVIGWGLYLVVRH